MTPSELIAKKRDGHPLFSSEIADWIKGVTTGGFSDYQSSALLMAIYLNGMSEEETAALTNAMLHSGAVLDLEGVPGKKVDKHSTGGVGDKTSLVIAPLAASCGLVVPMISGRGLGHTGGTLDKLESISGFRVDLSLTEFQAQLAKIGVAIVGQTGEIAPADGKLYALRDVTATVGSVPLICSSIMSKKLAEGIDSLVLDVKYGRGAFMGTLEDARELACALVRVGERMGTRTTALLTDMNQPLGRSVGNSAEIIEAIACLKGNGPEDLESLCLALTVEMLKSGSVVETDEEAVNLIKERIESGAALNRFRDMIVAQGGSGDVVDDINQLPQARESLMVRYRGESGFISDVDALEIGRIAMQLGAGRMTFEDAIDHASGISGLLKVGERIEDGQSLCRLHGNSSARLAEAGRRVVRAFLVTMERPELKPLVLDTIQ